MSATPTGARLGARWLFARTYIRVLTDPGDVVLDSFAGGNKAPAACVMTGRHPYACEIDQDTTAKVTERLRHIPPPLLGEELVQRALD